MGNHEHPCDHCHQDMRHLPDNHEENCSHRTMPCKFCETPTTKTSTEMCDNCWEVHGRISTMPIKVLNKIVKSARKQRRSNR